jgi:steroid delta-isomerase-like uncharacterized protein
VSDANKNLVVRAEEAWNEDRIDEALGYFADEYRDNTPFPGEPPTKEGLKNVFMAFRTGFPDAHVTIDFMLAEGDLVAYHSTARGTHDGDFMGIPPTGRRVTVEALHVHRLADGKIVEHWGHPDTLGLMRQLGVVPDRAPA